MSSTARISRGHTLRALPLGALSLILIGLGQLDPVAAEDTDGYPLFSRDRYSSRHTGGYGESGTSGYRYEVITRPARFKSKKTETDLQYEDRTIDYTEPQTVYRQVCEDKGSWQLQCRWGILGWRTECCWCPRIIQSQVPEVVNIARQRVERMPHEQTREVRSTIAEPVMVQVKRPLPKKTDPFERSSLRYTTSSQWRGVVETAHVDPASEAE